VEVTGNDAVDLTVPVRVSFDATFRALFPMVARTAGFVAHDAQLGADIAQEAFARLFVRWGRMRSDEHARNFVFRVAVNLAKSQVRRRLASPFGLRGPEVRVADDTPATDLWLGMADALADLSVSQRVSVVLVDYADFDTATVASMLGIVESTVRVHLMRGRRSLRAALALPEEDGS
jgi:RNA polymerase sigma-70 factor (ECF subfamily)